MQRIESKENHYALQKDKSKHRQIIVKLPFENVPDSVEIKKGEQHLYKCRIAVYSNIISLVTVRYKVGEGAN